MITDNQKDLLVTQYYDRGILKKEIRSYEVSLWTLQDEFITVLKWSDVEQKGRIENPKMTLDVDGTEEFTFSIPMYIRVNGKLVENPNWYNTQNNNLLEGMRKLKVIFNKGEFSLEDASKHIFEFVITKVTETHEQDIKTCNISSVGLAFQELGKVGYKLNLSQDNFELIYEQWKKEGKWKNYKEIEITEEPVQTIDYWCQECIHLEPYPVEESERKMINPSAWYYDVRMNWSAFENGSSLRSSKKIYEEPYTSSWSETLVPLAVETYKEKARGVSIENSNLYNITQTIAESFEVFCKYEFLYDDNYHIIGRIIVFYNNFFKENEPALSLQYPYSASKTERQTESTDITTKLFVLSVDNDNILEGYNSIANSPANPSREDYILNFDYMLKVGAINQEQYDSILPYEQDMRELNDQIIQLQQELQTYQNQEVEWSAKYTVYKNSIDLDNEQILQNSALVAKLNKADGTDDGVSTLEGANAESRPIVKDENGRNYIKLMNSHKGIYENTVRIYKTFNSNGTLGNEITSFEFVHDPYNNPSSIYLNEQIDEKQNLVYLTYSYQPQLYYNNVLKIWKAKVAQDTINQEEYKTKLGLNNSGEPNYDDENGIYYKIKECKNTLNTRIKEKQKKVEAFEHLMGPALREGYWQPEDYSDYGDNKKYEGNFEIVSTFTDLKDEAQAIWDSTLFDDEDKLDYKIGIDGNVEYYPCIRLNGLFNSIPENLSDYSLVWRTVDKSWDEIEIPELKILSIGSQVLIKFLKYNDVVEPVLVVVGAKTYTNDERIQMLGTGNARLEKYTVTVGDNGPIVSHGDHQYYIDDNWITDFTSEDQLYYPRIRFSNLGLKTDVNNLTLKYPWNISNNDENSLLNIGKDYYINTRNTEREDQIQYPEYYITIKPETLIKKGYNTLQQIYVNYVISNANTAIYLDAQKISKTNAEPQVSYNIATNILNVDLTRTLYTRRAQIVIINDSDLKLEDAFGYISKLELDLDNVQNDSIEIKNYKNKFEDLFSTIVAQTEEMKRNGNRLSAMVSGGVPLSAEGLKTTLDQNTIVLQAYLDSHFDSSQVVKDKLTELFTEAGEILADSNKALYDMQSLTLKNGEILAGFVRNVAEELSGQVYYSQTKPTIFKPNDIWFETDEDGTVIGRYIATSSNQDSVAGGTSGFVRTYDGTLASITGAAVDFNADTGIVDITAQNEINIKSGNSIYIAANENVEIVGNKKVNIGGTEINLCTLAEKKLNPITGQWEYIYNGNNISEKTTTGINLIAGAYREDGNYASNVSHILIKPNNIELGAAKLQLKAASTINLYASQGQPSNTSAISIDADNGVWIGSGAGIRLFSGNVVLKADGTIDTSTTGANIELNHEHLILGYSTNSTAQAIEMKKEYLIISSGDIINSSSNTKNTGVTGTSSGLIGAKFTKNSIGFATQSGTSPNIIYNAFLINDNGLTLASTKGGINLATSTTSQLREYFNTTSNGSFVRIASTGIELGTLADLYINANNFKLQTNPGATANTLGSTIFAVGTNLNGITASTNVNSLNSSSTVTFLVNSSGAFINGYVYASGGSFTGDVYADSFILNGSAMPVSYINSTELNNTISNNNTVSTAASEASNAKSITDAFTTNGLLTNYWWPSGTGDNHMGGTKWDVALTSNGNMLIGANAGLWIAKSAASSDGAAVIIDKNGIEIGSDKYLKVNTTNVKINPNAEGTNSVFFTGNTSGKYINYQGNGTLEIKGDIIADSFILNSGGYTTSKSWLVNTSSTVYTADSDPGGWTTNPTLIQGQYLHTKTETTLGGQKTITYEVNYIAHDGQNGSSATLPEWTDGLTSGTYTHNSSSISAVQLSSGYALVLGAGYGIFAPKQNNGSIDDTYVSITSEHINFDYDSANYIHMDNNGIDVKGSRIKINDQPVWARDDIVVLTPTEAANPNTIRDIESDMLAAQRAKTIDDWIMIVPSYNAKLEFTQVSAQNDWTSVGTSGGSGSATIHMAQSLSLNYFISPPDTNVDYFDYEISFATTMASAGGVYMSFALYWTSSSSEVFDVSIPIISSNYTSGCSQHSVGQWPTQGTQQYSDYYGYHAANNTYSWTISCSSPYNVCGKDGTLSLIVYKFHSNTSQFKIKNIQITAKLKGGATSRVPCAIYYYPAP